MAVPALIRCQVAQIDSAERPVVAVIVGSTAVGRMVVDAQPVDTGIHRAVVLVVAIRRDLTLAALRVDATPTGTALVIRHAATEHRTETALEPEIPLVNALVHRTGDSIVADGVREPGTRTGHPQVDEIPSLLIGQFCPHTALPSDQHGSNDLPTRRNVVQIHDRRTDSLSHLCVVDVEPHSMIFAGKREVQHRKRNGHRRHHRPRRDVLMIRRVSDDQSGKSTGRQQRSPPGQVSLVARDDFRVRLWQANPHLLRTGGSSQNRPHQQPHGPP